MKIASLGLCKVYIAIDHRSSVINLFGITCCSVFNKVTCISHLNNAETILCKINS